MDENEKRKELAVYLQDHYAGAVAAIEMLEHLIKTHAGKVLQKAVCGHKIGSQAVAQCHDCPRFSREHGARYRCVDGGKACADQAGIFQRQNRWPASCGIARNSATRDYRKAVALARDVRGN